jgi:hypothetical protein
VCWQCSEWPSILWWGWRGCRWRWGLLCWETRRIPWMTVLPYTRSIQSASLQKSKVSLYKYVHRAKTIPCLSVIKFIWASYLRWMLPTGQGRFVERWAVLRNRRSANSFTRYLQGVFGILLKSKLTLCLLRGVIVTRAVWTESVNGAGEPIVLTSFLASALRGELYGGVATVSSLLFTTLLVYTSHR